MQEEIDALMQGDAVPLSLDAHDRLVAEEERAFRARFGFDRPRRDRQNLIRLKHESDLTDREIRLLKWTGSLRFNDDGVRIVAPRGLAILGRIVIGFLGFEVLEASDLALRSPLPPWAISLRLVGVVVVVLAGIWLVQQIYLRPRQILQRVRRRGVNNLAILQWGDVELR